MAIWLFIVNLRFFCVFILIDLKNRKFTINYDILRFYDGKILKIKCCANRGVNSCAFIFSLIKVQTIPPIVSISWPS